MHGFNHRLLLRSYRLRRHTEFEISGATPLVNGLIDWLNIRSIPTFRHTVRGTVVPWTITPFDEEKIIAVATDVTLKHEDAHLMKIWEGCVLSVMRD